MTRRNVKRIYAWILCAAMVLSNSSWSVLAESMEIQAEEAELYSVEELAVAAEEELPAEEIIEDAEDEQEEVAETVTGETETEEILMDEESLWEEAVEEQLIEAEVPEAAEMEAVDSDVSSEESEEAVASGNCGTNVTWKLTGTESEGYTLTISGEGEIKNYSTVPTANYAPWYDAAYREYIKTIVVEDGVTRVGNIAFSGIGVEKATFADSVTSLGTGIFDGCTNLVDVKLPAGITVLSGSTFKNCTCLKSIELPSGLKTIGGEAFINCTSLESVKIPDGVIRIEDGAFSLCTSLKSITLPDSVGVIEGEAFDRSGLTSIVIPPGVTELYVKTFWYCSDLVTVEIPNAVTAIGGYDQYTGCFQGCESLTDVYYHGTEAEWNEVYIGNMNSDLINANFHYLSAEKIPMYSCEITLDAEEYVYAGEAITPVVSVKKNGTSMEEGTHYTVTYENNDNAGKATAIITGINDYTGEVKKEFTIIPRKVENLVSEKHVGWLRLYWDKLEEADGYEIRYYEESNPGTMEILDSPGVASTQIDIKGLERTKTYVVEVCAYKVAETAGSAPYYGEETIIKDTIPNLPMITDCWGFVNGAQTFDLKHHLNYFPAAQAREFKRLTWGVCFGMCISVVNSWFYDSPSTEQLGVSTLSEVSGISNLTGNQVARDAVLYGHAYEDYDASYNIYLDLESLETNIKDYVENNGAPMILKLVKRQPDGTRIGSGHSVLALDYEADSIEKMHEEMKIKIYDPNYPGEERYLYLHGKDDDWLSWSYDSGEAAWGYISGEEGKTNTTGASSIYYTIGVKFVDASNLENKVSGVQNKNLLVTENIVADDVLRLFSGYGVTEIENTTDSENDDAVSEKKRYWIDQEESYALDAVQAGASLSIVSASRAATVEVEKECKLVVNVTDEGGSLVQVQCEEPTVAKIVFKDYDSQQVKEVTVSTTSAADTKIVQNIGDESIKIIGVKDISVIEEIQDWEEGTIISSQNISVDNLDSSQEYQMKEIEIDGVLQNALLKDEDGDGVFDQVVQTSKACSHVYETITEKAATCSATGLKYEKCTLCGEKKSGSETTIPKKAHTYGKWTTVTKANVSKPEVQKRTCSVCKATETREYGQKAKPTITVNATVIPLKTKQSTTGLKITGLANGDAVASITLNNDTYVRISNVNLKAGTCKLTALKKKETKGLTKLIIKLKSGLTKEIPIKVQTSTVKISSITNVDKTMSMKVKEKVTLKPERNPFTSKDKFKYASSNKKIVKVTSKGVLTALQPGTAKITVKAGKKKAVCTVTVAGIGNIKASVNLKTKKSVTLKPKLYGVSGKVTYTSSNPAVATVNTSGKVTGVAKGTAVITVKAGSYTAQCKVKVK